MSIYRVESFAGIALEHVTRDLAASADNQSGDLKLGFGVLRFNFFGSWVPSIATS